MSLENQFRVFQSSLELTDFQRRQIIGSHNHLQNNCLKKLGYVTNTRLVGSYVKRTMIAPPDDVDIFCLVRDDLRKPETVLNSLKRDLNRRYPGSKIKRDKPCVVLGFAHCKFEVTPYLERGGRVFIPSSSLQKWLTVPDPNISINKIKQANARQNGKLVPLIKMMKHCARENSIQIKSFDLECKAIEKLPRFRTYRSGVLQMMQVLGWTHNNYSYHELSYLSDSDFAKLCRSTLFGSKFPR